MTGSTPEGGPARLHLNESPLAPPDYVVEAVAEAARTLNLYPDEARSGLIEALAAYAGAPADRLMLNGGSSELLYMLPHIAGAQAGQEMVLPQPTFPVFAIVARMHGLTVRGVPVDAAGAADVDAILAAITPDTALVCVPTPNNPTGGVLDAAALSALCRAMPPHVLFHLDEAYYEFGRAAGGPETLPMLAEVRGPWVSSRSASKAFGLAGLRLGYAIFSDTALRDRARANRQAFSVNRLALAAGRAAVAHADDALARVDAFTAERQRIAAALGALGLAPLPSGANFLAFPAAPLGADPVDALTARGLLTIGFAMPEGRAMIRASLGTRQDNDALLAALADLLAAQ
ncbi:MAG: histidinol-phosphate transaminase [Acuticoccus sp.]